MKKIIWLIIALVVLGYVRDDMKPFSASNLMLEEGQSEITASLLIGALELACDKKDEDYIVVKTRTYYSDEQYITFMTIPFTGKWAVLSSSSEEK